MTVEERTNQSKEVRDYLEHQINELKTNIKDSVILERAVEQIVQSAMFRIAQIWIGDIKWKD